MSRRARITVLELGASATAWASCRGLGTDDWIVVAQQSDEAAAAFSERVRSRARRLCREDAQIESVDVYAGPRTELGSADARRGVVEGLSEHLAQGGRLTLWSGSNDRQGDVELAAILAQFGPVLAERQIAMNHQTCDGEERSGVRHAIPARSTATDDEFDFGELG